MPDFAVRTAFTAVDKISPAFRNMESSASSFQKTASRAFMAVGTFATGYLVKSFVDAAAQTERLRTSFKSVFGSDAANQMRFVREETNRLGIDMMSSAEAYKGIAAAAKGTAITNRDVQQTFLGVSEAAAALQLTGEQSQGALLAISQIISKGKVSMEELRGQLGERIPGAMQIAARSMGVTTAELEKMVAAGIPAEKFIPRFAAQMRKEFGPAALESANSFNALSNKFNNSVFDMKSAIGETLLPALIDLFAAFQPIVEVMRDFFRENKEGISAIIKLVPWVVGGFIAWKFAILAMKIPLMVNTGLIWGAQVALWAMQAATWGVQIAQLAMNASNWANLAVTIIATAATWAIQAALWAEQAALWAANIALNALTAAQWALNAAMSANPIGLVIIAVAALIAAGVALYRNWDVVTKWFSSAWETVKEKFIAAGNILWDWMKAFGRGFMTYMLFPINLLITGVIKLLELASSIPGVGEKFAKAAEMARNFQNQMNATTGATNVFAPNRAATEKTPSYANGVNYVPQTGLALLHKGEKVTPANQNKIEAPNKSATELLASTINVNIYSNGTEAKAEVTPRRGATVNMNRLGYQQ